ncbi:hypothetical protein MJO28_005847 [Puccinia striiformis f. sp. tritici]|uniref:Uncharacterized protein n=1 Tax=Puccinia striiformis f. sp. tritici TaxID=168172 RepID=A0ACC0EFX0_9BASI|nr:hypothetical protein MJO28_005847 [Puccinia striiformis f. sp. tritici]
MSYWSNISDPSADGRMNRTSLVDFVLEDRWEGTAPLRMAKRPVYDSERSRLATSSIHGLRGEELLVRAGHKKL